MTQWAEIRHQHEVLGIPKKEIARRFEIDVKTVRRALASDGPPKRATPPRSKSLDPRRPRIEELLRQEPKLTSKRIGRWLASITFVHRVASTVNRTQYLAENATDLSPGSCRLVRSDPGAPADAKHR